MNGVNGRERKVTDWREFQQSLFKQIPFSGGDWQGKGIESFVNKTLDRFLPKSLPFQSGLKSFLPSSLDYELFETHRSIFVRCKLPLGDVRLYATRRKLKVQYNGNSEEIPLPSDVNTSRAIARHHGGILEIRMPKLGSESEPFREIFIRDGGK